VKVALNLAKTVFRVDGAYLLNVKSKVIPVIGRGGP
jgi:hypothetical protein